MNCFLVIENQYIPMVFWYKGHFAMCKYMYQLSYIVNLLSLYSSILPSSSCSITLMSMFPVSISMYSQKSHHLRKCSRIFERGRSKSSIDNNTRYMKKAIKSPYPILCLHFLLNNNSNLKGLIN